MAISLSTLPVSRLHVGTNAFQILEESWIAYRHGRLFRERHIGSVNSAKHREGHREAMIFRGLHATAWWPVSPFDVQIILTYFGVDPHGPQIGRDELESIALFHAQLADFPKDRFPPRPARKDSEHRYLVDERRNFRGGYFGSFQVGRTHHEIGDRLATLIAQIDAVDARPHALQDDQKTGSRRIHPNVLDEELAAIRENRGSDEKGGAGRVSGDGKAKGRYGGWAVRRFENDRAFPLVNPKAQMSE